MFQELAKHWYIVLPIWTILAFICFRAVFYIAKKRFVLWVQFLAAAAMAVASLYVAMGATWTALDFVFPSSFDPQQSLDEMGSSGLLAFLLVTGATIGDSMRHVDQAVMSAYIACGLGLAAGVSAILLRRHQGDRQNA